MDLIREVAVSLIHRQLRCMFAYMLVFSNVNDLLKIRKEKIRESIYARTLFIFDLAEMLLPLLAVKKSSLFSGKMGMICKLSICLMKVLLSMVTSLINWSNHWSRSCYSLLIEEQRRIFEKVLNSFGKTSLIAENRSIPWCPRMFLLDAPGGTGKTFFLTT